MYRTGLKTGDLDLDLQGQIGLETTSFEPWEFYLKLLDYSKNL